MVVINRIELLFNAYETFVLPLNYMTIVWLLAAPNKIKPLFDDYQSPVRYATIKLRNSKLVGALGIEPSVVINWLKANYLLRYPLSYALKYGSGYRIRTCAIEVKVQCAAITPIHNIIKFGCYKWNRTTI